MQAAELRDRRRSSAHEEMAMIGVGGYRARTAMQVCSISNEVLGREGLAERSTRCSISWQHFISSRVSPHRSPYFSLRSTELSLGNPELLSIIPPIESVSHGANYCNVILGQPHANITRWHRM